MISKLSKLFLVTAFLISTTSLAQAAPSVAGASCSKAGATNIYLGKKFTCTKVGGKLKWNKGVVITSAKSAYSNLSKSEADVYSKLDLQIAQLAKSTSVALSGQIKLITQDAKHERNKPNLLGASVALDLMKLIDPAATGFTVYTWSSVDWIKNLMKDECPNLVEQLDPNSGGNAGCGKLFVTNLNGYNNKTGPEDASWMEAAHEAFHIYQTRAATDAQTNYFDWWKEIPSWYREGSATVFGSLVRSITSKQTLNYGSLNVIERSPWRNIECKKAWQLWQERTEAMGHSLTGMCEYGLGRKMSDLLAANYGGYESFIKVHQYIGQGVKFEQAFEKVHGISLKNFFVQMEAYLTDARW
jgi:hypothetical protein